MPLAGRRCLRFCTALGGLAQRYLHDPPVASDILTDLVPLMDISIVDHWCRSWFGRMRYRRIVAPISFIFRAGMGTLRRPSSPQQQYLWSFFSVVIMVASDAYLDIMAACIVFSV